MCNTLLLVGAWSVGVRILSEISEKCVAVEAGEGGQDCRLAPLVGATFGNYYASLGLSALAHV